MWNIKSSGTWINDVSGIAWRLEDVVLALGLTFSLYPVLGLPSPGRRWYEVLLGPLPLCGKVTLACIFRISSPLSFLFSPPSPPFPFFCFVFFFPCFDLNCLCLSCWLNCQVNYSKVLIQVNASDCPLFFMCISSYGLLSNGFWNVA